MTYLASSGPDDDAVTGQQSGVRVDPTVKSIGLSVETHHRFLGVEDIGLCYRFRLLMPIAFLVGTGCFSATDTPAIAPGEVGLVEKAELAIELQADTPVIRRGEIPRLTAHLVNRGAQPMKVVLPGDGSSCGWRTPVIRWAPPMQVDGRCGNINALKAAEVITVGPGERVELRWLGWPTLATVGTQQVSLEIEHLPDLQWAGRPLGEHDPEAMAKIRQSK